MVLLAEEALGEPGEIGHEQPGGNVVDEPDAAHHPGFAIAMPAAPDQGRIRRFEKGSTVADCAQP
ncbi:hypothetical protein [Synechococcus sp. CCY 9618]|uniref:hypothetical protein n=1 Tax=Synechococcus sp. CCY 9618 TaxID=2815602 RepID=UPI001C24E797|nr:hypothetical protein [Synechococcus sp. CCY 9618]